MSCMLLFFLTAVMSLSAQDSVQPEEPSPESLTEKVEIGVVEETVELIDYEVEEGTDFELILYEDEEVSEGPCSEVFFICEDMPKFQGESSDKFRTYIAANLKYPEAARKSKISGRVIVQFTVDMEGEVINVVVVRGVDPRLDSEAVRVVKSSPAWTPGRQRGRLVCVQLIMPIVFALQ